MRNQILMHDQVGLSLIELMIAMVVGLILIAGVLSIFLSSRQSFGINGAVAQIQENARFALEFIRKDTRMAGYMGCGYSGSSVVNQLNSSTSLPYDFSMGLTGFEYSGTSPTNTYTITAENPAAVGASNWSPSLSSNLPTSGSGYAIPGSDMLVMSLSQGANSPAYVTSASGAQFWITVNNGITADDIMVVSNCVSTVIVQATNVTSGGTHIVANTGGSATPGNAVHGIPANMIGAQVSTASTVVFYIGEGADGSPALYQATTDPSQASGFDLQELVPGVENMQILYGVDTTGSFLPSEYDTADVVTANNTWNQVVSVRVALLLRSNTGAVPLPAAALPPYDLLGTLISVPRDTRLRQVFNTTIALRNRLATP